MEAVQVGLAEAPLFDLQQLHFFELLEVGADAALRGSHVLGEGELAGEARVVSQAYLSSIAYASLAPTEISSLVRMKFGTCVKPWRVARSAPTISMLRSLRMSPMCRLPEYSM